MGGGKVLGSRVDEVLRSHLTDVSLQTIVSTFEERTITDETHLLVGLVRDGSDFRSKGRRELNGVVSQSSNTCNSDLRSRSDVEPPQRSPDRKTSAKHGRDVLVRQGLGESEAEALVYSDGVGVSTVSDVAVGVLGVVRIDLLGAVVLVVGLAELAFVAGTD